MNAFIVSLLRWKGLKDFSTLTLTLMIAGTIMVPTSFSDNCEISLVLPPSSPRKPKRSSGRPSASGTSGC
jgi:hypothetical protein